MLFESLPPLLDQCKAAFLAHLRSTLLPFNLSEPQWRVIRALRLNDGLSAKEIIEKTALLGPSLSRIIRDLESMGLIKSRYQEKDSRTLRILLTAKGERLHDKINPKVSQYNSKMEGLIGESRLTMLKQMLDSMGSFTRSQ